MEVSRPFFSIVIPTRNRASLLRSSLRTALDQAFDDFEVVVCDNNSSDDTRAVVESFMARYDRLRYVNPGRDLSMCDNWDFALEQAAGAYITYLSDDDGLILEALPYIYSLISKFQIKVLTWPCAYYHHMDVPEENKKGALYCDITSGKLFEVPSEIIIEGLSNFDGMHFVIPKALNCVFARSVLDKPQQYRDAVREKRDVRTLPVIVRSRFARRLSLSIALPDNFLSAADVLNISKVLP
jgi:glycosyltransferase involved in cell wall biosynthesis